MWWNHIIWCCFHGEKCKKQKKIAVLSKSFTSYLHNRSTSEHNSTRLGKLQCMATSFVFCPFLVIGHVTTLPMTYWMDPDRQNHPCLVFLHFFIKIDEISFFGYIQYPERSTWHPIHHSYLLLHLKFLQWNAVSICWIITMKYPEIHLKNHNESCWILNEKSQWNALGI